MSVANTDTQRAFTPGLAADFNLLSLLGWLESSIAGFEGPFSITKFTGGQSNPTYRLRSSSGDYVLRRKPFGHLLSSAHAVDREYRVLGALHAAGFPVPRPIALCDDDAVIGTMFYLMEMVDGRIFWDGGLPRLPAPDRRQVYNSVLDTLAALHNVDVSSAGLDGFGRTGNHFGRQVERWSKQYRAAQTEHLPEMEALIQWLPRTVPEQTRTSVVHGDYRLDNLVFAPDEPRVAAVLDWELATIGDPLGDFAYLMLNWVMPHETGKSGLGGLDLTTSNIPTLDESTARYCAATGRDGVGSLDWHFAFCLFRGIGILQGVKRRMLDGNASSSNVAATVRRLPDLLDVAWNFARRAGAPSLVD